jgi:hypothetical protein
MRVPGVCARRVAAILFALLAVATADAHRAPGSLTTIEFNARSGQVEIVHRLHRHDAELGVGNIVGEPALSLNELRSRAQLALYVEERFRITADGEDLPLDLVGTELAGDYLLVYQERARALPPRIAVRDDILRDAFPTQVNQVNITDGEEVHTLTFAGDDVWHEYAFKAPTAVSRETD